MGMMEKKMETIKVPLLVPSQFAKVAGGHPEALAQVQASNPASPDEPPIYKAETSVSVQSLCAQWQRCRRTLA